ncbi:MAG: response regulator transcription factor [Candidatus Eremiobacterota bacterium]
MARIALVEDEEAVAQSVAYGLRRVGHDVEILDDGEEAARRLSSRAPDLVVLDVMLPGLDGLEVCRRLRDGYPELPILILSARGEEEDRVRGFESGADDYLVKPFSLRELEHRVSSLLRRSRHAGDDALAAGPFRLHPRSGIFTVDDQPVHLSPREMDLMSVLMERPGQIVPREELLERVWGKDFMGEAKTLDVHVRWLRSKLEANPSQPRYIVTVRGRGFRLDP